jgi:hypothetical protein
MEIFGMTFSISTLFFVFVLAIGLIMMVFFRNKKYNLLTIQAIGKELEAALQPKDQTYTWIGGTVGCIAEYITKGPIQKVDATITMLARQSVLFYPISKLLFGNDRLFVVVHPHEKVRREAHVLEQLYYRLRLRKLEHAADMKHQTLRLQGKTFHIFATQQADVQPLSDWMQKLSTPDVIKHVAIMPENNTIYLYMVARVGTVEHTVKALMNLLPK